MSGTVGKQVIRLSETVKKKAPLRSKPLFTAGIIINTLVGPIIDMAAYSFAAQSLIAPFGGLDVVWNAALAPYILQEKLTPQRVIGCALICLGTVMAGAFGSHTDKEYSIESLEELLVNFRVLAYFVVFFAWYLMNVLWLMKRPIGDPIRGVSLGATAGTITGNMFCVKAAVELIQVSIHGGQGEVWLHWMPYVMLLGAVFFAVTNVFYMTRGLQEFEALFMVTVYEGSMIVSNCISGAVVLLDLNELEPWRIMLYCLGVLVVVAGMFVVFGNEVKNKSSLASGKASLPEEELRNARKRSRTVSSEGIRRSQFVNIDVDMRRLRSITDDGAGTATPVSAGSTLPGSPGWTRGDGRAMTELPTKSPDMLADDEAPTSAASAPAVKEPAAAGPSADPEALDPSQLDLVVSI